MERDSYVISVRDLRVDYDDCIALRDVTFHVKRGEIYGLIGPNGAGKTTTLRVLATLLEPTYGNVTISGVDILTNPKPIRPILGYMPDEPPVDDELRVWEYLDMFGAAYGIAPQERKVKIEELLTLVALEGKKKAFCGTLSRGMRQRLVLAKTLLPSPKILLLDEPAAGLDPMARIQLRRLLQDLSKQGTTVLISSHVLAELSGFCTSLGILEKGQLVASGSVETLGVNLVPTAPLLIETLDDLEPLVNWLKDQPHIKGAEIVDRRILCEFSGNDQDAADLLHGLVNHPFRIKTFSLKKPDVEDIFLKLGMHEVQ